MVISSHKSSKQSENDDRQSHSTSQGKLLSQHSKSAGRQALAYLAASEHIDLRKKKSTTEIIMSSAEDQKGIELRQKEASLSSVEDKKVEIQQPAILKSSCQTTKFSADSVMVDESVMAGRVSAFEVDATNTEMTATEQITAEFENRRKNWLKHYKTKLDLNDVLEIRNPQSVIEFIPEIVENMQKDEVRHIYPASFLDKDF